MRRKLLAWLGKTDLRAQAEESEVGIGPIAQAVSARAFDEVILLSDYSEAESKSYARWLRARSDASILLEKESLSGPTHYGEIFEAAVRQVNRALGERPAEVALTFHLSPGTPAMASIWLLLAKTRFPAELIESSKQHGVRTVTIPFDISLDVIPELQKARDERLKSASAAEPPSAPEFSEIVYRSREMAQVLRLARAAAVRNVPVLIEGESGTGKELLARAIHRASPRREREFVTVNCGAIPEALVESELFGHEKGAFTDARSQRRGFFEAANGGTLFLDEVGELPHPAQVKLLRVVQEGEVVRVGATKAVKIDVRVIAATNRTLTEEIANGRFREDLFYRLAVAVLKLPALRDRTGDIGLLVDRLLGQVNREFTADPGYREKKLSAAARNLLLTHPWPGNVRELLNTLRRATIWSEGASISGDDLRQALLPVAQSRGDRVLGRPLGDGFSLPELLREVSVDYLTRAMNEAHGNKTKAATLVGLANYQTLTNWLERYDVEGKWHRS